MTYRDRRLFVSGGREGVDDKLFRGVMMMAHVAYSFREYVHGGARGVDKQFDSFVKNEMCVEPTVFPYKSELGLYGGPARNAEMYAYGDPKKDIVIIFEGGKGTRDALAQAKRHGYTIYNLMTRTSMNESLARLREVIDNGDGQ